MNSSTDKVSKEVNNGAVKGHTNQNLCNGCDLMPRLVNPPENAGLLVTHTWVYLRSMSWSFWNFRTTQECMQRFGTQPYKRNRFPINVYDRNYRHYNVNKLNIRVFRWELY